MGFSKYTEDNYELYADRIYMRSAYTSTAGTQKDSLNEQAEKSAERLDVLQYNYERKD